MAIDDMYTLREVARKLRLTVATVRSYARQRRLRAVKFGREWRVSHEEFERFKRDPESRIEA